MRIRIYRRWIGPDYYVEVAYRPKTGEVDVREFRRDPRKAQYHKPKFWNRGLWMPWRPAADAIRQLKSGMVGRGERVRTIQRIIEEDLGRTSSVGRALAS